MFEERRDVCVDLCCQQTHSAMENTVRWDHIQSFHLNVHGTESSSKCRSSLECSHIHLTGIDTEIVAPEASLNTNKSQKQGPPFEK